MVGVYERWILPRLLDLSMRNRLLDHYRQRTIETARGLVLEVGVGSGLNLRFYSRAVDRVCGIDLSPDCYVWRTRERRIRLSRCRCSRHRRSMFRSPGRPSMRS
jgi:SAM-dependent methyltransferase